MMTTGWHNILWQHIILQLSIPGHGYRKNFWFQLVCLIIQIKRDVLWDLRDLWCGLSACASFNSRATSEIPVFTTTTPEPTKPGCSTRFWVAIQFHLHNNSARCALSFKQFNYVVDWEVTSLCIVISDFSLRKERIGVDKYILTRNNSQSCAKYQHSRVKRSCQRLYHISARIFIFNIEAYFPSWCD